MLSEARREHLGEAWTADDYSAKELNSFLKDIVDFHHPESGEQYLDSAVLGAFREYLGQQWASDLKPPFAIRAFASKSKFSQSMAAFASRSDEVSS